MNSRLEQVCGAFRIEGTYQSYEEIKVGHINSTYKVNFLNEDGTEKSYIVQSVNTYVFKHPIEVMENIDKVTEHIRAKKPGRVALHFHHTRERNTYVIDESGFWRLFNYIPSTTYSICRDMEIIRNAGEAFGEFQMMLADFDPSMLHVTIQDFHNTKARYRKLLDDIAADPLGMVSEVVDDIEWLMSVKDRACMLTDMHEKGRLPLRVTHNDTKINNVLFEKDGIQAIAVIDLDTVMPGLIGHDFGDAIRFAANFVEEDSRKAEKAGVNIAVFREFAEGFLMRTASTLTKEETDTLALSCFVLATEQAVRFLDDYIMGSTYFRTEYDDHNLLRTRCQIALAKDILKKLPEMDAIVRECVEKYR